MKRTGMIALIMCLLSGMTAYGEETTPYSVDTPVQEVMSDPAFEGYGRLLFPVNDGYWSGDTLGELRLTWYSNVDPNETVEIVNTLHERASRGETVFYDLYTDEEKAEDPAKEATGCSSSRGRRERSLPSATPAAGLLMWARCMTAFRTRWNSPNEGITPLR